MYDEAGHLLGEYDQAGVLIQETIWLGDTPVGTLRPDGASVSLYYVHADHLDTPRRVSRPADNVVVWRWDGDPFGATAASEDPDGDATLFAYGLRFPGQYYDRETNLNYNYFRDYDPQTGRYVESDPIGLEGGLNTYTYADANSVSKSDPTGENPRTAWWVGTRIGGAINFGVGAATGSSLGALLYDVCNDDPSECEAKYFECTLTSLADKPGSVWGQNRCGFCKEVCYRQRKWPGRAPTTTGWVRCDYWNYSRVRE